MVDIEKSSRRQQCILDAVIAALAEVDYSQLTIEDLATRAGVGKSTIYRWWKNKPDLILAAFRYQTSSIFDLDFQQSLAVNLQQQLLKLSHALHDPVGRALLVVIAENRETAGLFFQHYLRPRREQTHKLIQQAIDQGQLKPDYPFELMLDSLYGPIHYQIIFFNQMPDSAYIEALVNLVLQPALKVG